MPIFIVQVGVKQHFVWMLGSLEFDISNDLFREPNGGPQQMEYIELILKIRGVKEIFQASKTARRFSKQLYVEFYRKVSFSLTHKYSPVRKANKKLRMVGLNWYLKG